MRFSTASLFLVATSILACAENPAPSGNGNSVAPAEPATTFTIVAGSENKDLADIFTRIANQAGMKIKVIYKGSVDIGNMLRDNSAKDLDVTTIDAVMPASSFWLNVADTKKLVKDAESTMRSPVILGVRQRTAERLKWIGRNDITVAEIIDAIAHGQLRTGMTSPLLSNSGAVAYFGILSANARTHEALTHQNLNDADVQENTARLLKSLERSLGSSGDLKDLMVNDDGTLDAMFNYEAMVIKGSKDLVASGKEPLHAIYPVDGTGLADYPFGCVDHGNADKTAFCHRMQEALLAPDMQAELERLGRHTGEIGLEVKNPDPTVWNPDWGIKTVIDIAPIPMPSAEVAQEALDLYTTLRKPAFKIFVLDVSGSMNDRDGQPKSREERMKDAMQAVLIPDLSRKYGFPTAPGDVTIVITYSDKPNDPWVATGNDEGDLRQLAQQVRDFPVQGGTDTYNAVLAAHQYFDSYAAEHPDPKDPKHLGHYSKAIILMTDGLPNKSRNAYDEYLAQHGNEDRRVFPIQFGEATESVLKEFATDGSVFDGQKDLTSAIRSANGNN